MKNRNENDFGIIVDKDHQFNSLEEAGNYVKDLKDKLKNKASMEEFPITTAMPEDRLKFIDYGISLMTKKNLPFIDKRKLFKSRALLYLVAHGYTFQSVANWLRKEGFGNATIDKVKEAHKEAMRIAKDAIDKVRNSKVPVLGG